MRSIGPDDVVTVKGNHLYRKDGSRFFIKGIAFPMPFHSDNDEYDPTGWIAVLHQLHALHLDYNTVRVYRMDPAKDYSAFFEVAASLGVYVIVPLTGAKGRGVLDRDRPAPRCYSKYLFRYGIRCLRNYVRYPNVLAGVVGNEVVNSLEAWPSAPCIKAYAADLQSYMEREFDRDFPLMYATQHSALGPAMDVSDAVRLTVDYLTCTEDSLVGGSSPSRRNFIDIFGVNVESWCSSQDTFLLTENGSPGTFYTLWKDLHNSTVPLVMSEMGCDHQNYDRDNGLQTKEGTRDWLEVPVVLGEMADTWSGFCAYAYYGNENFQMFKGGPWYGNKTLKPSDDFFNFRDQLSKENTTVHESSPHTFSANTSGLAPHLPRSCVDVEAELASSFGVKLYDSGRVRSFDRTWSFWHHHWFVWCCVIFALILAAVWMYKRAKTKIVPPLVVGVLSEGKGVRYGSISTNGQPTK